MASNIMSGMMMNAWVCQSNSSVLLENNEALFDKKKERRNNHLRLSNISIEIFFWKKKVNTKSTLKFITFRISTLTGARYFDMPSVVQLD